MMIPWWFWVGWLLAMNVAVVMLFWGSGDKDGQI